MHILYMHIYIWYIYTYVFWELSGLSSNGKVHRQCAITKNSPRPLTEESKSLQLKRISSKKRKEKIKVKNKTTFKIILGKKKKNVGTEKQVGNQFEQRVGRADTVFLKGIHTKRATGKENCDSLSQPNAQESIAARVHWETVSNVPCYSTLCLTGQW